MLGILLMKHYCAIHGDHSVVPPRQHLLKLNPVAAGAGFVEEIALSCILATVGAGAADENAFFSRNEPSGGRVPRKKETV